MTGTRAVLPNRPPPPSACAARSRLSLEIIGAAAAARCECNHGCNTLLLRGPQGQRTPRAPAEWRRRSYRRPG